MDGQDRTIQFCISLGNPKQSSCSATKNLLLVLRTGDGGRGRAEGLGAGGRESKYDDVLLLAALCFELFPRPRNGLEWFRMAFRALPLFFSHGTEARVVSLPRNGSERNSERILLFLIHGTEFRVVFSSVYGFGTEC
jgi:hypothetical protein